jgi:hypothetical protein
MGYADGETGYCSETCVKFDVDRTEGVNIKVEEAIDIKDEIPEAIAFPSIKTEHEVWLWGVCEVVAANAFRQFIATNTVKKCEIMLKNFLLLLYCVFAMYLLKFGM